jgi:hypothetical protein
MRTITYAVYDETSGEVVHVHVEPYGLDTAPEEILQIVAPSDRAKLKVMRVPDDLILAGSLRAEKGELRSLPRDGATGRGGINSPLEEPSGPRRYEQMNPHRPK